MTADDAEDLSGDLPPKLPETLRDVTRALMLCGGRCKGRLRGPVKRELEALLGVYPTAEEADLWKEALKAYREELMRDLGEPESA